MFWDFEFESETMPPSDAVTIIVSTGLGLGLIAGIVSGVCYVLVHGLGGPKSAPRRTKPKPHWLCAICGSPFRSIRGVLDPDKVATCQKCGRRICKKRCAKKQSTSPGHRGWLCKPCLQGPSASSWFQDVINTFQTRYKSLLMLTESESKMAQVQQEIDEDIEEIRKKEKEQVRDFLERLVASLLGGNVDEMTITRMYDDEQYLPVVGQLPCTAHATLKQIIERLISEAEILPKLRGRLQGDDVDGSANDEQGRMYEDLLATAILNKVVSKSQSKISSSAGTSDSSRPSSSKKNPLKQEYFFGDETLEDKWRKNDFETSSVSSLEEWLQSDSSLGSTKYVDRMSLTIQQHIDGETVLESSEEEENTEETNLRPNSSVSNPESSTSTTSNWFLQRRSFNTRNSPIPVPMLVPNPSTDAKVLIGDKEVEDTSDLSDAGSEFEEPLSSGLSVNSLLVESKMIIGGKNVLSSLDTNNMSDDERSSSTDSGVIRGAVEVEETKTFKVTAVHEVRPEENGTASPVLEDLSLVSTNSKTEKDAEYTEKYIALPSKSAEAEIPNCHSTPTKENNHQDEKCESLEFEGSYSRKEKEKWKKPVELKNNPYSKESIEKRIKKNTFGRDYYLRQASNPSGAKNVEVSPEFQRKNSGSTLTEDAPTFRALPALAHESLPLENDEDDPNNSPTYITSDSELSFNCYDVEQSKIFRKSSDGSQQEVAITMNSEGLLYSSLDEDLATGFKEIKDEEKEQVAEKSPQVWTKGNSEGLLFEGVQNNDVEDAVDGKKTAEITIRVNEDVTALLHYDEPEKLPEVKPYVKLNSDGLFYNPNFQPLELKSAETPVDEENHQLAAEVSVSIPSTGLLFDAEGNEVQISSSLAPNNNAGDSSHIESDTVFPSVKPRSFKAKPVAKQRVKQQINDNSDVKSVDQNQEVDHFDAKPVILNKKADNTLIKKIYSNPMVKNYAVTSRPHQSPPEFENSTTFRVKSPEIISQNKKSPSPGFNNVAPDDERTETYNDVIHRALNSSISFDDLYSPPAAAESSFSLEYSEGGTLPRQTSRLNDDSEIGELKQKKLVANRLGEFSKSFPNLKKISWYEKDSNSNSDTQEDLHEETLSPKMRLRVQDEGAEERTASVRDLRKLFEKQNKQVTTGDRFVHSLTARSIPRNVREGLKNQNE